MKIDFARLNHILIPKNKDERDKLRNSRIGRAFAPVARLLGEGLTDEGRTLATMTLLVGAFGVNVRDTTVYVLFSSLAALVFGSVVVARRMRLEAVDLRVESPPRVTVNDPVTFTVVCERRRAPSAEAETNRAVSLRVRGPFLPYDGAWIDPAPSGLVLRTTEPCTARLRARFTTRGIHHLDPFTAALVAPLGLARGPRLEAEAPKLHVVPRIADVASLPLGLTARHQPGGVALASKNGESMDLLGLRPYRPGDPVRDLHARSWARTGVPVVREWQEEYFTRVGVVLDSHVDDDDVLEVAIELVAGVVARLARSEALVDVLVVGDRVHDLTLGRSLGTLDQALDFLATVERGPRLGSSDFVRRLEPWLERLSCVFLVVTSLDEASRTLERAITERGVACKPLVLDEATRRRITQRQAVGW